MSAHEAEQAQHVVRIKHDPESHEYDCHDDCTAEVICNGVTDLCRTWWECSTCRTLLDGMDSLERADYLETLDEEDEAHGEDHQHIDGMWMTPTNRCLSVMREEDDAAELIHSLPDGDFPVSLDWDEGYLLVRQIRNDALSLPPGKGS